MNECCKKKFLEVQKQLCCDMLASADLEAVVKIATFRTIPKDDFFIKQGDVATEIAVVCSGLLRHFYSSSTGENTLKIILPQTITFSSTSFLTGQPSMESIQALEDTEILVIQKKEWETLCSNNPVFMNVWRLVAEDNFLRAEKHMYHLMSKTAAEHYEILYDQHPCLMEHAPLKYIASILGIDPRHLSRIRKMKRIHKRTN